MKIDKIRRNLNPDLERGLFDHRNITKEIVKFHVFAIGFVDYR